MGDQSDYGERLASLEARLAAIEAFMARLESKLDAYQTLFVPRAEINEMFRSRDERIARLEEDAKVRRSSWPAWISSAVAVLALVYTWIHGKGA